MYALFLGKIIIAQILEAHEMAHTYYQDHANMFTASHQALSLRVSALSMSPYHGCYR